MNPHNNLVLVCDTCCLGDFGFSHLSFSLAVEQHSKGSLNWMAPERVETSSQCMSLQKTVLVSYSNR